MYELFFAVGAMVILGNKRIGLIAQEASAGGTHVVVLELLAELLCLLWYKRSIAPRLDGECQRDENSGGIE